MQANFPESVVTQHGDALAFLLIVAFLIIAWYYKRDKKAQSDRIDEQKGDIAELKKEMNHNFDLLNTKIQEQTTRTNEQELEYITKIDALKNELTTTRHSIINEVQAGFAKIYLSLSDSYISYKTATESFVDKKDCKLFHLETTNKIARLEEMLKK